MYSSDKILHNQLVIGVLSSFSAHLQPFFWGNNCDNPNVWLRFQQAKYGEISGASRGFPLRFNPTEWR